MEQEPRDFSLLKHYLSHLNFFLKNFHSLDLIENNAYVLSISD